MRAMALVRVLLLLLATLAHADPPRSRLASRTAPNLKAASRTAPSLKARPALLAATAAPPPALGADRGPIALLLLLYTLQGIPMGLGSALPMLMLERGVTTMEMAVFSTVALPFAIKLLWAPLVDSVYSAVVGRRKTWLIPVQAILGLVMLLAGGRVDALLAPPVDVRALTALFLGFYFLAATQVRTRQHPPSHHPLRSPVPTPLALPRLLLSGGDAGKGI